MDIYGVKNNKCFLSGIQGVCSQIISGAPEGESVIFAYDNPANNSRFVLKEYVSCLFGQLPQNPSPDFNFNITFRKIAGFTGSVINALFRFAYSGVNETPAEFVTINWDNPDFSPSGHTVIHVHIWYDGINYCGRVDGY